MSENRGVRMLLEMKYGKGCMFKKANIEKQINILNNTRKKKIKTFKKFKEERKYTRKKLLEQEKLMSVHHLRHRSEQGDTSVENCTLINRLAHDYIHSLKREDEEVINDMLREYKKGFKLGIAKLTTEGAEALDQITFDDLGSDYIEIKLEDNTKEDMEYLEHKRKRNERVFKKFEEWER